MKSLASELGLSYLALQQYANSAQSLGLCFAAVKYQVDLTGIRVLVQQCSKDRRVRNTYSTHSSASSRERNWGFWFYSNVLVTFRLFFCVCFFFT